MTYLLARNQFNLKIKITETQNLAEKKKLGIYHNSGAMILLYFQASEQYIGASDPVRAVMKNLNPPDIDFATRAQYFWKEIEMFYKSRIENRAPGVVYRVKPLPSCEREGDNNYRYTSLLRRRGTANQSAATQQQSTPNVNAGIQQQQQSTSNVNAGIQQRQNRRRLKVLTHSPEGKNMVPRRTSPRNKNLN